jgi:hypothetical protein
MNKYYVTIKQEKHNLANKVLIFCDEQDLIEVAEHIRNDIAGEWGIGSSSLDWAIFDFCNPYNPFFEQNIIKKSDNFQAWAGGKY